MTPDRVRKMVTSFRGARVLVLGDIMLDEYLSGDCSRLSPEAPVPVLHVTATRAVAGGAANTAANVASLGGRATLMGMVGRDAAGDQVARNAASLGIELVAFDDGRPTMRKVRVVGQHQQLVRLDYEEAAVAAPELSRKIVGAVTSRLGSVDIVIFSDYAKGLFSEDLSQQIIAAASRRGVPVIADPRPQHKRHYRDVTYITPNWKECLGLLGWPDVPPSGEVVAQAARTLASELNANVILTLGAQGLSFLSRDGREHFDLPTQAKEVFDVSGAGDTVVATFALGIAVGGSHVEALTLANKAAGIVVGKFGTALVHPRELIGDDTVSRMVAREELAGLASRLRDEGKRVVTANGSFDVIHAGHVHILEEARRQGDVLIVGLNSDESIRGYKGPSRPIYPQEQRARLLLSLRMVDYVHVFDEAVPMPFLEQVRPDVHVNGAEYGSDCVEAETVAKHGGRLHLVDRIPDLSTSSVIERFRQGGSADPA